MSSKVAAAILDFTKSSNLLGKLGNFKYFSLELIIKLKQKNI